MADLRLLRVGPQGSVSFTAKGQASPLAENEIALVQCVLNLLLSTRGSDVFNPETGGLADLCRMYRANDASLRVAVEAAVAGVEYAVREEQKVLALGAGTRLRSLVLSDMRRGPTPSHVDFDVSFTTEDGNAFSISF